jgi:hypothetical protein
LGRYEICEELGRGGMAVVHRVFDPVSRRFLAAKQLLAQSDARTFNESCVRFEREFHTLSGLSHPRIIEVYDYTVDAAGPFYTMELLDGGDLLERSPIPWQQACALFYDVCSSLALLHSRRLVHCDISPRNVRCTKDGRAKLFDFGAMVPMGRGTLIMGTPSFTAPEVVARTDLDARTDLYSLGAALYYALTGRVAFAARDFPELIDAWSIKPRPPSQFVPGIPEALDRLTLSLLSLEAGERPRNAFEVMQRLAVIADIQQRDTLIVSQAYLSTPAMVGREPLIAALREEFEQALAGRGRAVIVSGSAGLGRSRVLDVAVIAAKLRGVCVLRASADAARGQDFAVARTLCEQLLELVPDATLVAAAQAQDVLTSLFEPTERAERGRRQLRLLDLTQSPLARAPLQDALSRWLLELAQTLPIAIAVDDVQRCDDPTAALLAMLAAQSDGHRLILLLTMQSDSGARGSNALEVLAAHARTFELTALSAAETISLLTSVFGDVPHLRVVGHAVHTLAGGNPRLCMELARHLVEHGTVRYADGNWTLPACLSTGDLPESAETALRARVAALTTLARQLLEAQALASHEAFTREDYGQLSPGVAPAEVDAAVSELVARELLVSDGRVHWLVHRGWSGTLTAHMGEQAQRERHTAIAALYGESLKSVFHYFAAGLLQRGLDLLLAQLRAQGEAIDIYATLHIPAWEMARLLQRALTVAQTLERSPIDIFELQRRLVTYAVAADDAYYWHAAPAFLERLRKDSGLALWQELAHVDDKGARLTQALQTAFERFASTPEAERVCRPDEAIRYLVQFVAVSIAISFRSYDTQLVASLPGLLEPFAPLSPAVDAIYQNAVASRDFRCLLRTERARRRWLEVYEKLSKLTEAELPHVDVIRRAIAAGVGNVEAALGLPDIERWAALVETDPMQVAQAFYLRKVTCLQQGDWVGAEEFRKRAEHSSLQARVRPMFLSTVLTELVAHARAADLTGVKQLKDRITLLAAQSKYWRGAQLLAEAMYQRLCGRLEDACRDFEACMRLSEPDASDPARVPPFWLPAVAGAIETLVERCLYDEAKALGLRVLSMCREREIEAPALEVERALALAHAKLGELETSVALLSHVIAAQQSLGVTGLMLGASYEARARVAIWARDEEALIEHGDLTALEYRRGAGSPLGARYERLMDEARLSFPHRMAAIGETDLAGAGLSGVERQPSAARVASKVLRQATTATERATFALSLLCEDREALGGHLYLVAPRGWVLAASQGVGKPEPGLAELARAFLMAELEETEISTRLEAGEEPASSRRAQPRPTAQGLAYPVALSCVRDGSLSQVGVALLVFDLNAVPKHGDTRLAGVLASQLLEAGDARHSTVADLTG